MSSRIRDFFVEELKKATAGRGPEDELRLGAEMKFPLVKEDGAAADLKTVHALWQHLRGLGWELANDPMAEAPVGAKKPGEKNDTVASCETGFCKPEFSLAHVAGLFGLEKQIQDLKEELRPFAEKHNVHFLGYGIQPVTPPSRRLMMKKTRASVWDKVFGANRVLPEQDGDDVCLFTVNAAQHIHAGLPPERMIQAVNVLNGFAGAQVALTANSSVWRGRKDPEYKCVAEKFWDWWMPERNRAGIPEEPFENMDHYIQTVANFKPVYVKRDGAPVLLKNYPTFAEYFRQQQARGQDLDGNEITVMPHEDDIRLHNTCYWFNARVSGYFTVENRANDQQPPGGLMTVGALTLGLCSALDEAWEELRSQLWPDLRRSRGIACQRGLADNWTQPPLAELSARMLDLAKTGLRKRGLGEETFLAPLEERCRARQCPADEAASLFEQKGIESLLSARSLTGGNHGQE